MNYSVVLGGVTLFEMKMDINVQSAEESDDAINMVTIAFEEPPPDKKVSDFAFVSLDRMCDVFADAVYKTAKEKSIIQ